MAKKWLDIEKILRRVQKLKLQSKISYSRILLCWSYGNFQNFMFRLGSLSIEANFNKSKPFHFLHLQVDSLFQQEELTNKSHLRKVQFILFDNSFMKAHPVGYCSAIAIQKHKTRRWLSPAPFFSQLTAYLRVAKGKQGKT